MKRKEKKEGKEGRRRKKEEEEDGEGEWETVKKGVATPSVSVYAILTAYLKNAVI